MREDERTISVKYLLCRSMMAWRKILIWMVVMAVLCNIAFAVHSWHRVKQAQALLESTSENTPAEPAAVSAGNLTSREITEVQAAVEVYKTLRKDYLETIQYIQNSIYMQINPNAVSRYQMQFLVDTHYEVEFPKIAKKDYTPDILQSYALNLNNAETGVKIADTLGYDTEASYIRELLSISSSNNILTITIIGKDEESCRKVAGVINEELQLIQPKLQTLYGEYDFTKINEEYYVNADSSMADKQLAQTTRLNNAKNVFNNLQTNMTDAQKSYYKALLDQWFLSREDIQEEVTLSSDSLEPVVTIPRMSYFSAKYVVVGLILGFLMSCCWTIFSLFLGNYMQSEADFRLVGAPVLGELTGKKNPHKPLNVVDRWILTLFYPREMRLAKEDRLQMIGTKVRMTAGSAHMKSVYITGTDCSDAAMEVKKHLADSLSDIGKVSAGNSVLLDSESLRSLSEYDGVVLVESLGGSFYDEVCAQQDICKMSHIPILGYVVLRQF